MKIVQLITAERRTVKLDDGNFLKVNPGQKLTVNDHEAAGFIGNGAFVIVEDLPDIPAPALVQETPQKENKKAAPAPVKKQSKGRK